MADIAMCLTENCPLAQMCYRKTAWPDLLLQSYALFVFKHEGQRVTCPHYIAADRKEMS